MSYRVLKPGIIYSMAHLDCLPDYTFINIVTDGTLIQNCKVMKAPEGLLTPLASGDFKPYAKTVRCSHFMLCPERDGQPIYPETAIIIAAIEHELPDIAWFIAKGRCTPEEPLYGLSFHDPNPVTGLWDDDADPVVLAECEDLEVLVAACVAAYKGEDVSGFETVRFVFPKTASQKASAPSLSISSNSTTQTLSGNADG